MIFKDVSMLTYRSIIITDHPQKDIVKLMEVSVAVYPALVLQNHVKKKLNK
jgi:hypothetical protein